MRLSILIALLALSGCAVNGDWTRADTYRQVGVTAMLAADAYTTAQIHTRPDLVEGAPLTRAILGANPDPADTYMFFGTLALSNWMISRALPEKWRPYWQVGTGMYHAGYVINNCNKDLC